MLHTIKKLIPKPLFRLLAPMYHYIFGYVAALRYGFPSEKLLVIGVTGTTGKTSVTYMLAHALQGAGVRVGYTSTAMFHDGEREWLNDKKMTMLGRFFSQKMLRRMVDNGCEVAIVETTSEGAVQFRHRFINYDVFVFTGLYPEHIESHGSFLNYKNAKLSLFEHLANSKVKKLSRFNLDSKVIVANGDDEHAEDFLDFSVGRKIAFTTAEKSFDGVETFPYSFTEMNADGVKFALDGSAVQMQIFGEHVAQNAAAVGAVGASLGIKDSDIIDGLEQIANIPGRIERIDEGQNFSVIVDYAFEPVAFDALYKVVDAIQPNKIIHVLGAAGGGRDTSRREILGTAAGERADTVIVTNEDPYDDYPMSIIRDVADGAMKAGKEVHHGLYLIEDRKTAIEKALSLAGENDLVLITGKGCEQAIAVANGKLLPWDDRAVVRDFLSRK